MRSTYTVTMIPTPDLAPIADGRKLDPETVKRLAESIRVLGVLNPLTVIPRDDLFLGSCFRSGYQILAGHHRYEAACYVGLTEMPCIIMADQHAVLAELTTIEENLLRLELTTSERSLALARRREIYDALDKAKARGTPVPDVLDTMIGRAPALPESTPGERALDASRRREIGRAIDAAEADAMGMAQSEPIRDSDAEQDLNFEVSQTETPQSLPPVHVRASDRTRGGAREQTVGFEASEAKSGHGSKATNYRSIKHVDDLGEATVRRIDRSSLDSHPEMTALAQLDPAEREALVAKAEAGEKVSAVKRVKAKRKAADPRKAFFKSLASGLEAAIKRIEKATGQPLEALGGPLEELGTSGEIDPDVVDRVHTSVKRLQGVLAEIDEFAC